MDQETNPLVGIETLEKLSSALQTTTHSVEAVRIHDPLEAAEESFAQFAQDSFTCLQEDLAFEKFMREELMARQSEAKYTELAHIYLAAHEKNTARMERLINPFTNLAMATRAAAISSPKVESIKSASEAAYSNASKDVLQGVVQLSMLLERLADVNNSKKQEEKPSEEKIRVVSNDPSSSSSSPSSS